ncbi:hypothetical protein NZ02_23490 [Xanthomonas phaseoli pv. phaseoli]|nr:hypothetical protein RM64_24600 [Xanthomonas phaseoli pv. phaseoli]KKY05877.1 hypothetical protein RN19_25360 [Xanthomonas phaseoli pv. phaseoli]KKY06654.1 hypothetical protein NZ02_24965 [Xanthomonas phaseoli pv. phaseoli]KKY07074.1 hypothetical protein NZ02_23490 [Xanthomonas phaseoli pv. phaseoli]
MIRTALGLMGLAGQQREEDHRISIARRPRAFEHIGLHADVSRFKRPGKVSDLFSVEGRVLDFV